MTTARGAVAFGETVAEAVIRAFHEELGVVVCALSAPLCLENLFQMDGKAGTEIVFVFDLAPVGVIGRHWAVTP